MTVTQPIYTAAEQRARETFLALMWALSYPGRSFQLPQMGEPFALIAETLLDLETSYFTPDPALHAVCAQTAARALAPETAAYHFYPLPDTGTVSTLARASVGTMAFPDTGATLIIGCQLGVGQIHRLHGPGIAGTTEIQVAGLPEDFWPLRANASRFPLGWDVFLVDGTVVIGLPRSTRIESVG